MKNVPAFIFCLVSCAIGVLFLFNRVAAEEIPKMVGGPCTYSEYAGAAKIISIDKLPCPEGTLGKKAGVFRVRFVFEPHDSIPKPFERLKGKPHDLRLVNGSWPTMGFLRKYEIHVNKELSCCLKVIKKGTCTPVLFDFPTIDRTDYEVNQ